LLIFTRQPRIADEAAKQPANVSKVIALCYRAAAASAASSNPSFSWLSRGCRFGQCQQSGSRATTFDVARIAG
jgi:hypothetical protein